MVRVPHLILLPAVALALSGCVAGMVASAVGMAAGGGQGRGEPRNVEFMLVAARQACTAHASQYGTVEITGLKQADGNEIIVSGIVTGAGERSSFQCSFVTEITAFDLRSIPSDTSSPELDLELDRTKKFDMVQDFGLDDRRVGIWHEVARQSLASRVGHDIA